MSIFRLWSKTTVPSHGTPPGAPFGPQPSGRFLILFEGRTGSTWLCNLLGGHPQIRCQHEILHARYCPGGQEAVHRRFREAVSRVGGDGKRVLGLQAKLNQLGNADDFRELLVELRVDVIHMKRRNIVKQVNSELRGAELAQNTGQFNLYKDDDRVPEIAFGRKRFGDMLNRRLKREAAMDDFVRSLPLRKTLLHYEELQLDREGALGGLFDFLDVPHHDVTVGIPKQPMKHTSDDLREAVLNFDELKSHFAGTKYESMFDEVLVTSNVTTRRATAA